MTVREYLGITRAKRLSFLVCAGMFEDIVARDEKWGRLSYPPNLEKYLDQEIEKVFVDSKGVLTFHTH